MSDVDTTDCSQPRPPSDFFDGSPYPSSSQNDDATFVPSTSSSRRSSADEKQMEKTRQEVVIERARLVFSSDPAQCRQLLAGLPFRQEGWCRICTLQPSKNNGYIQVSSGGANKFAMLQEVVLWAGGGALSPGEQCSHLCGQPRCMGLDHIIAESELENQRRKGCLVWVDCCHCELKVLVCPHGGKKCVKFCTSFRDAADFEARGVHRTERALAT